MRKQPAKMYVMAGVITLITVVGLVLFTTPAKSQLGVYFSDQFNLGTYDWKPYKGTWAIVNGWYSETVDPSSEEAWSVAGSSGWTDYIVEAKVYSTDSNGTISLAGRWYNEKNYYALEYSDTGSAGSAKLTLYKRVNGARVDLADWKRQDGATVNSRVYYIGEGADGVADNVWPVTLKLKFVGAQIYVYVNNYEIGYASDTSLYYGKIALGEYNRKAFFDDIYVWDITPPRITSITHQVVYNACTVNFATNEYTSYEIDYGLTNSYGSTKKSTVRTLYHAVDLTGLAGNTTYHYRVKAMDAGGNAKYSEDRTFTTGAADNNPPVITNVTEQSVLANNAVIEWDSSEPGNSIIEYGTQSGVYKLHLSYDEKVSSHSMHLSQLASSTTYYYRVKTRDLAGNLGTSAEKSFTTLKNLKPRITRIDTGSDSGGTVNLTVYWDKIPDILRYKVFVDTDNNWSPTPDYVGVEPLSVYTYKKTGLLPDTNYYIRVQGEDDVNEAAYSIGRAFPPDANPHGYYWDNPELCQNCHAAHLSVGPRLIIETSTDKLCITCHDGSQSKYDVLRGLYRGPDAGFYSSVAGPYGDLEDSVVEEAYKTTSRHDLNIFNYAATGNNIEDIDTADARLSCASCHDPHGSDNYRNLRVNMRVSLSSPAPLIESEAYAVTGPTSETVTYVKGAVEFCGACHSDFNQGAGASRIAINTTKQPGMKLSSASLHMYMHPVNIDARYTTNQGVTLPVPANLPYENGKIICQTCHYTHGTIRQGEHTRRDGYRSTVLKRFNEDDGCEDCHNKTDYPDE